MRRQPDKQRQNYIAALANLKAAKTPAKKRDAAEALLPMMGFAAGRDRILTHDAVRFLVITANKLNDDVLMARIIDTTCSHIPAILQRHSSALPVILNDQILQQLKTDKLKQLHITTVVQHLPAIMAEDWKTSLSVIESLSEHANNDAVYNKVTRAALPLIPIIAKEDAKSLSNLVNTIYPDLQDDALRKDVRRATLTHMQDLICSEHGESMIHVVNTLLGHPLCDAPILTEHFAKTQGTDTTATVWFFPQRDHQTGKTNIVAVNEFVHGPIEDLKTMLESMNKQQPFEPGFMTRFEPAYKMNDIFQRVVSGKISAFKGKKEVTDSLGQICLTLS